MDEFNQLCVWQGVTLEGSAPEELEKYFKENLDVTVKFSEAVITNGSVSRKEEGGRSDLLFYILDDDVLRFAETKLALGIRWWEDVVFYNDGAYLYSKEVLEKYPVRW